MRWRSIMIEINIEEETMVELKEELAETAKKPVKFLEQETLNMTKYDE